MTTSSQSDAPSSATTEMSRCIPQLNPCEIADHLEVMRMQEETTYRCSDYFANPESAPLPEKPVDNDCRVKMCHWCYQVTDFCNFRRETVSIGMSLLDRFLSTKTAVAKRCLSNRKQYQLAAMTALYTAIKINEPMEMETSLLSDLSRGCYTEVEISQMEVTILTTLGWRVHGPTALSFVSYMLALLPSRVASNNSVAEKLVEFARIQTEFAVADYYFVSRDASIVAVASILNAMEVIDRSTFSNFDRASFLQNVARLAKIDLNSNDVSEARRQLVQALPSSTFKITSTASEPERLISSQKSTGSSYYSPVCVSRATAVTGAL